MSSVVISGDTSGSVTLQAPAVAGTTVLTLPSTSGTVLTTASGTAATATNLAGGSNGTIPYQSASGTTQMLAVGTSGQVLQTNGAGAPSWVTPSAGAMTLISTQTLSGATSVSFTGLSSYSKYLLIADISTLAGSNWSWTLGTGATPTYITSGYTNTIISYNSNGVASTNSGRSGSAIGSEYGGVGSGSVIGYEGIVMTITGAISSTHFNIVGEAFYSVGYGQNSSMNAFGGSVLTSAPLTAIKGDLGASFSGTVSLYGISS